MIDNERLANTTTRPISPYQLKEVPRDALSRKVEEVAGLDLGVLESNRLSEVMIPASKYGMESITGCSGPGGSM